MLLVRVRVGPSSVDGLGAFAVEPIASGTVVWHFTPGLDLECDPALLEAQPPLLREVLLHCGWIDPRTGRFLLCCDDDARFIIHSSTPNLRNEPDTGHYGVDVAARDIAAGEELTLDYAFLEGSWPGGS